jgi:hypothetical protein
MGTPQRPHPKTTWLNRLSIGDGSRIATAAEPTVTYPVRAALGLDQAVPE